MELAKPRPHHHPFHLVRTFAFTTCQVTSSFHFGETFKEQWARSTQCGHDLCYTVLINRDSFFHNKRCRRSNYSVKNIRSQGGRYSVLSAGTGRSVKEQLSEMPKLFEGKLVFFLVVATERLVPKPHMNTDTESCSMPKPSCHVRFT